MSQDQSNSPMHQAIRCRARSKRTGQPCRNPCVKGWRVCRLHGVGGGAPKGNKNAWRHGHFSAEAIAERRRIRDLIREARELCQAVEKD
jgi:uncharacterized protein YjcR